MQAIVLEKFGGVENFQIKSVENPELAEKSVRVKIRAVGFNPIDYQMRRGGSESRLLKSLILGREMAGIVTEIHPTVKKFKVGDEVFSYISNLGSNGSYAEEVVVPESILSSMPANLTFNQAAAIPLVGLTAMQTVIKCSIKADESVFIAGGAGGVGNMINRLLLINGAKNIFTTAGNDASRDQLISIGLKSDKIFDYKKSDLAEKIIRKNDGNKFDCCLDTVGNQMSDLCAEIIKIDGRYADISFLTTESAREALFDKGVTILNISNYAYGLERNPNQMKIYGENLNNLKQQIENETLKPILCNVLGGFSVATVANAHQLLENNQTFGRKLIMEIR